VTSTKGVPTRAGQIANGCHRVVAVVEALGERCNVVVITSKLLPDYQCGGINGIGSFCLMTSTRLKSIATAASESKGRGRT
jgi:hypothetical protein